MAAARIPLLVGVAALSLLHLVTTYAATAPNSKEGIATIGRCGISLRAPKNWFVHDPKKIEANIRKLDGQTEDIGAVLSSHRGSIEIASYAKHNPRGRTGLIPTINVLGRANPTKSFEALAEVIRANSVAMGSTLRNYVIKTDVTERTISGRRVLFFVAEFDLTMADGGSYRVASTTYVIPCDQLFLQISMSESLPAKHEQVFAAFIESLSFKQP